MSTELVWSVTGRRPEGMEFVGYWETVDNAEFCAAFSIPVI